MIECTFGMPFARGPLTRATPTSGDGRFRFDENGDTTLQIITIYDFETGAKDWRPVTYLDVPDQ